MAVETKDSVSVTGGKGFLAPGQSPSGKSCKNGATAASESTPTHDGTKEDFQRSLKSQKISAVSLNNVDTSLNSHEITFNISMTEFDEALEEEKTALFKLSYDESIKKAETVMVLYCMLKIVS